MESEVSSPQKHPASEWKELLGFNTKIPTKTAAGCCLDEEPTDFKP